MIGKGKKEEEKRKGERKKSKKGRTKRKEKERRQEKLKKNRKKRGKREEKEKGNGVEFCLKVGLITVPNWQIARNKYQNSKIFQLLRST